MAVAWPSSGNRDHCPAAAIEDHPQCNPLRFLPQCQLGIDINAHSISKELTYKRKEVATKQKQLPCLCRYIVHVAMTSYHTNNSSRRF